MAWAVRYIEKICQPGVSWHVRCITYVLWHKNKNAQVYVYKVVLGGGTKWLLVKGDSYRIQIKCMKPYQLKTKAGITRISPPYIILSVLLKTKSEKNGVCDFMKLRIVHTRTFHNNIKKWMNGIIGDNTRVFVRTSCL